MDDGSTPENLSALGVLEREYDSRFSFLRRGSDGVSHGPDFAGNAGVAQTRGRYVTFLYGEVRQRCCWWLGAN